MPNVANLGVGNAVPGVPSGAMRKHRARKVYRTAAFGGRNAEDGVPYGFCKKAISMFRISQLRKNYPGTLARL